MPSDPTINASPALVIRLAPDDDVVLALRDIPSGTAIPGEHVASLAHIPAGHKMATHAIAANAPVRRYSQVIGFATRAIAAGEHVHIHNLEVREFDRNYQFGQAYRPTDYASTQALFNGIVRRDGRVATRNYIGVLSTVNCSATVCKYIAEAFRGGALGEFPNVNGVVSLTHTTGCGMGSTGEGIDILRRTIAGYLRHPNFAGVLLVGLGCEANQMMPLLLAHGLESSSMLRSLTIQDAGGTTRAVAAGIEMVRDMLAEANAVRREPVSARHLTVGLQCGGSDSYSGITANPALGAAVDMLVRHGGTAILSETPEIYGAEHLLTSRAASREVGEKLVARIRWWEDYTTRNHGEMNNNPSPGNKAGGLTTILEKSLGAVTKGGTTGLVDVVEYAEPIASKGLVFMDSPGYDPVSATGQVASGANLICFTTGRGSVYGCKPAPSLKLATNSALYRRMSDDMDFNCGEILDGLLTVEQAGARIFRLMLATASGLPSRSELHGFGADEFVPWQLGAVM
jgi:altronate hydrolase